VFVAYAARAEMSCFAALHWPIPRYILDLNIEYRHYRNDGGQHRHKLLDAMHYFGLPTIESHEKQEMIDLAIRGGPFTPSEMHALQDYCASDTRALQRLLPAMAPHIDLVYALVRGRFTGCVGQMEHLGVPVDLRLLHWLHEHWEGLRALFVGELQRYWDLFDDSGKLKTQKFTRYIDALGIPYWPRTPTGHYRRDKDTLRDMAMIYPAIKDLREGFDMLGQLRALKLAVGRDGRNRTPLWPISTKTMRCAPSTTEFVFNLPAWLRSLVKPAEGRALAYLDFRQEEPAIAACLSRDQAMSDGYRIGGDLYVDFAKQAQAIPCELPTAEAKAHYGSVRDQYKICLLASMYGQQERSLASRMGKPPSHAAMLLRQLRRAYPRFTAWIDNEIDWAYLHGYMRSRLDWTLYTRPDTRETSLLNYPMQVTGSEVLHRAVYQAQLAGVQVYRPRCVVNRGPYRRYRAPCLARQRGHAASQRRYPVGV
jgi:DNA polymerase-1